MGNGGAAAPGMMMQIALTVFGFEPLAEDFTPCNKRDLSPTTLLPDTSSSRRPPHINEKMNWSVTPIADWSAHATDWALLNKQLGDLPFFDAHFMTPLIAVFTQGKEVIAVARDDSGEICAMGIFCPAGFGRWQTFQPSQLPLGAWLALPRADIAALLAPLVSALPGLNLGVSLTQLDEAVAPRPADAERLQTLDYIRSAWVDVSGSFDDYWAARGKNLRSNMRKQRAKLEADHISVKLETLREPEQVAQAIAEYGQLESTGWKSKAGTAIHPANDQGRFYRAMMESFCQAGRGCIYRYRFDDRVVAMDLCIESADTLVILKTTYDESFRTLSPAFLMRQEVWTQLFAAGQLKRIEFFGKLMEWHTRWTDQHRALFHLNFYRWRWLLSLRGGVAALRPEPDPETEAQPANAA
jgi:CelD/BcsL family acetyltransferase involved in cellulose biosynthesis